MKWPFLVGKNKTAAPKLPRRVLIIENDKDLQNVYTGRLQAEGIEAAVIASGKDLVNEVIKYQPGVVILDIGLDDVSGLDALAQVRSNPQTKNTKVMIVSALSGEAEQNKALELKADQYIIKSKIILDDMVEDIKRHLEINRSETT